MFSRQDFFNFYTVIGGAFVFLWYCRRSMNSFWRKLNVKYLKPVPFLGNTFKMLFCLIPKHEEYDRIYKALDNEPFGGIYIFHKPQLIVKDPELVSAILIKDFKHFQDRGFKKLRSTNKELDPLSVHILFTTGERWKVLRQRMTPVFSPGKLKHMHEQVKDCIELLLKYIDNQMDGNDSSDVGLKELFEKLTIDVIGSCAFGIDCNSFKSNEKFSRMGREALSSRIILVIRFLLTALSQRLSNFLKISALKKEVTDFFLNLTWDTIEYRRKNGVSRNDLLQLLMELQNSHIDPKFSVDHENKNIVEHEKFNELDIAANVFIFFIAGFETSASTLSYCLYELAFHQDIQENLYNEVKLVKDKSQLTYESLREMKYMDAIISETLRKYPPIQVLNRECTEDYVIPGTTIQIPAGTLVAIPVWSIQHDCKYYPHPEVFDPERFLGDNKHSRPSGTFLSFGDGPRYCLGKRFAEMEIKATLSEMILKYNIEPCTKTEISLKFKNGNGFLQTTCGLWVKLSKRRD